MEIGLDLHTIELFIVFVVPGLISMSVYRLLMPSRRIIWGEAVIQGLFYSSLNFVLLLPLIVVATSGRFQTEHPWGTWFIVVVSLVVVPAIWPVLLKGLFKSDGIATKIRLPYPTAWDYLFELREASFVLVHLEDGELLGGYYGGNSYAGSFPHDGDIYLEAVYEVNEKGEFGDPIPDTKGVLLRKEHYSYLELYEVQGAS
ncbi:MAG: DUF6338 family protein [Gemmatimonadota bacterium]